MSGDRKVHFLPQDLKSIHLQTQVNQMTFNPGLTEEQTCSFWIRVTCHNVRTNTMSLTSVVADRQICG